MKKLPLSVAIVLITFWAAAVGLPAGPPPEAQSLQSLPQLCDFEMRRITSADPKGGNRDFRELPPGQTLVLAELSGPGCIVHFRDNITSSEPHHLQVHVLRMYWDGETTPSVEVPVGDFFGVGFGFTEKCSSALMCIDQRRGPTITNPAANGAARNCYIPMPFAKRRENHDHQRGQAAQPRTGSRSTTGSSRSRRKTWATSTPNTARARRRRRART